MILIKYSKINNLLRVAVYVINIVTLLSLGADWFVDSLLLFISTFLLF